MIYRVRARLKEGTAAALLAKLTDGTVAQQKPDGAEIVASLERAVVNAEGDVEWSETCYCGTPLAHERATVLDAHFDELTTKPIEAHGSYEGKPFMDYLRGLV